MKEEIIKRLTELPEEIRASQEKLLILSDEIENLTDSNKKTEYKLLGEITDEKDAEDKTRYTNDLKRKAELSLRLEKNLGYQHVQNLISEKIKEKQRLEIQTEAWKRQFISAEVIGRML
jgi:uncharacterized protein (DUF342 family)